MKKFKIEIDGEEFIVKAEEIRNNSDAQELVQSSADNRDKGPEKKAKTKSYKKIKTQEMSASTEVGEGDVAAPMPGSILEINVKKGEAVNKGDSLIVLEAMKMENQITAVQAGTVKDIKVRVGDSVDAEDLLLVIE